MSRFPPPPQREDPILLRDQIVSNKQQSNNDQSDEDNEEDEDDLHEEPEDYLTEQYLRDKQALFNREMVENVEEIDTTTVQAKNIITLILRNDVPYIQRRIITLLSKTIAENSLQNEFNIEQRTHDVKNTSMLTSTENGSSEDAKDFSCQINIISKSDFTKRQNDKRLGYIQTPLHDPRDNFNAELYFNSCDKMYSLRPGKPVIKSFSTQQQLKQDQDRLDAKLNVYQEDLSELRQKHQQEQQNNESGEQKNHDANPLNEFLPDDDQSDANNQNNDTDMRLDSELTQYELIQREMKKHKREQEILDSKVSLQKQHNETVSISNPNQQKNQNQSTFLLPGGLGLLPSTTNFNNVNDLINLSTSEACLNDWRDSSVTGLPLGHIFLHSTLSQSTHQLMINALSPLPTLIIYCADAQSLGRGRSANAWVSPPGCLMYNFSIKVMNFAFLPFIQYYSSWVHVKSLYFALQHTCECSQCRLLPHNRVYTLDDKSKIKKLVKIAQFRVDHYNKQLEERNNDNNNNANQTESTNNKNDTNNTHNNDNPNSTLNKTTTPARGVAAEPCMSKIKIDIKWPNDLYVNGKKVSGTLLSSVCDMQPDGRMNFTAHLGTGLNVANGYSNGKNEFSQQHSTFVTINDAIMESYRQQLQHNRLALHGDDSEADGDNKETKINNNDQEERVEKPIPALLDDDDMELLLQQENDEENQYQRRLQLQKLQQDQEKYQQRKLAEENALLNDEELVPEPDTKDGQNDDEEIQQQVETEWNEQVVHKNQESKLIDNNIYLRPSDLPLLTKEVLLASITLNLSQSIPHFNQFGFKPFETDYYSWWLHSNQQVSINTAEIDGGETKFVIVGLDNENGYLLAKNQISGEIVELHPETHSFDINTLSVKPKKPASTQSPPPPQQQQENEHK